MGKLAIAALILRAESGSPLVHTEVRAANAGQIYAQRLTKLTGGWHALLGQILYEGHTRETVENVFDHSSFVIFNYDRCIEEFLTTSMMRRFAIDRNQALAVVARCRIVHPYGKVGTYFPGWEGHIPFGGFEDADLAEVAAGIKTFTESMEQQIGDEVKDSIARAETIVFMGFGWLPQNIELLHIAERLAAAKKVFATTMDMPTGELEVVKDQIDRMLRRGRYRGQEARRQVPPADFIAERGDCKALMSNCWLRLTSD